MSHAIAAILPLPPGLDASTPIEKVNPSGSDSFAGWLNTALEQVSHAQAVSTQTNQAVITGAPGASMEQALIASAHARIGWNATVAVRNDIVNAYKTIMNMPV